MKRLILVTLLHTFALFINAYSQIYTSRIEKKPFNYLSTYTEYPFSQPWDEEQIRLPVGFNFTIYGETFDSLIWGNGRIYFKKNFQIPLATGDTVWRIHVYNADLKDAGTTNSLSPVRYFTSGPAGQRVFTLEVNNAVTAGSTYSLDIQVSLYEGTNEIIIHFNDVKNPLAYLPGAQRYRIGISEIVNLGNQVQGLGFQATDWNIISVKEKSMDAYIWQQVYDSLQFRITQQENFFYSNFSPEENKNIINNTTQDIQLLDYPDDPLIGLNLFLDKGVAMKYTFEQPVYMKGLGVHAYGKNLDQTDILKIQIHKVGSDGFPGAIIDSIKIPASCLNLDGSMSLIDFDKEIKINDSCMISLIYPEYDQNSSKVFHFAVKLPYNPPSFDPNTVNVLMANDKWYSVVKDQTITGRFDVGNLDSIYVGVFPYVNNYLNNNYPVQSNVTCAPLSNIHVPEEHSIILYPNPAKGMIFLKKDDKNIIREIEVISQQGISMTRFSQEALIGNPFLDLTSMEDGVYLIKIIYDQGYQLEKIILAR